MSTSRPPRFNRARAWSAGDALGDVASSIARSADARAATVCSVSHCWRDKVASARTSLVSGPTCCQCSTAVAAAAAAACSWLLLDSAHE